MSTAFLRASLAYWRRVERAAKKRHTLAVKENAGSRVRQHGNRLREARKSIALRERQLRRTASTKWGGCRAVTDEVVRIVGDSAPVTSRKRVQTFGNPGSDHHVSQKDADAVDFGIADAHWLKNRVSAAMGGPRSLPDYGAFHVTRNGKRFRVQMIAGTHGTGPHLHVGVRRA